MGGIGDGRGLDRVGKGVERGVMISKVGMMT